MIRKWLAILGIICLIAVSALCVRLWDQNGRFYRYELTTKLHFAMNREAFEQLGAEFNRWPLITSVSVCDPDKTRCTELVERRMPDDADELALYREASDQHDHYQPLLGALNFPGFIWFEPSKGDPQETAGGLVSIGGKHGIVGFSTLVHFASERPYKSPCPSQPYQLEFGDCAVHLGGEWWLRYAWSDFSEYDAAVTECAKSKEWHICRQELKRLLPTAPQ
jgi:hypothetical protein